MEFEDELSMVGLFHHYHEELSQGNSIDLHALARDCFFNNAVAGIVQAF